MNPVFVAAAGLWLLLATWDGKLPEVVTDGNMLLNFDLKEEK